MALTIIAFLVVRIRKLKQANGQQYAYSEEVVQDEKVLGEVHANELGARSWELSDETEVAVELPYGPM
jgi:hypothetical protein